MKAKRLFMGSVIGFVNGFFASGGGIVAVLALERLVSLEEKKAHATAIFVILPMTLLSIFVYHRGGYGSLESVFKASLGGILGAVLGAKLLSKLPKVYIRAIFGCVMIIAAVKMFF